MIQLKKEETFINKHKSNYLNSFQPQRVYIKFNFSHFQRWCFVKIEKVFFLL